MAASSATIHGMEPLTLEFIAQSCGGDLRLAQPGALVRRVCPDSRALREGDLFVALRGENFDGHAFVPEAGGKGAVAALVERLGEQGGLPSIVVRDTRTALGQIAATYRRTLPARVIAVAGSNGKTSAKELIRSVLTQAYPTHASQASFNNDIGVPLTLLGLDKTHAFGVVEIGSNHPGELEPLARMAQPEWGVITSIGREHLEFFHDLRGVAEEEGALGKVLPKNGKLFLNGDSPQLDYIIRKSNAPVTLCGLGQASEWRLLGARVTENGTTFRAQSPREEFCGEFHIPLLGEHQALNALIAMAVGAEAGLTRGQVTAGLARAQGPKMRLELVRTPDFLVLNDAYNANADSMAAAFETFAQFPAHSRRVAILGDMGELGEAAEEAHEEIGKRVAKAGVSLLIAVGRWSGVVAEAASTAGLGNVARFPDVESAAPVLRQLLQPGDTILVKASRSARLERLVAALEEKK